MRDSKTRSRRKKWVVAVLVRLEDRYRYAPEGSVTIFIIEKAVVEQFRVGTLSLYEDGFHLDTSV